MIINEELLKTIPEGTTEEKFEWMLKRLMNTKPLPMKELKEKLRAERKRKG